MGKQLLYPWPIRQKCLRMYSDGASLRSIQSITGVQYNTFKGWAKAADITQGSKLSEDEFANKMESVAASFQKQEVKAATTEAGTTRRENAKARRDRKKFGPTRQDRAKALLTFSEFADPTEYEAAIDSHKDRIVAELGRANTPEDQVKALTAGILMAQLKTMVDNPPPIVTWADGERVINLLRKTLGMDAKGADDDRNVIDLRVLNASIKSGKVIELKPQKTGNSK